MADIYDAARAARGTKSFTSTFGNNDCPRPKAIMENVILFIAIANWDSICRFDNITPERHADDVGTCPGKPHDFRSD